MKLIYLLRSPGTGHSIEALFGNIQQEIKQQTDIDAHVVRLPHISRSIRSVWQNLMFLSTLQADVYHITGDAHYVALALPAKRTVLTIHDCITLINNQKRPFRYGFFWLFWYYLPIRRAAVVTVVSEKTRQELIRYVGGIGKKTIVVPNSYNPAFTCQPMSRRTGVPVLLQIGTAPHKNLANLIAAIDGIDCILSIVGPLTKTLLEALQLRCVTYRHYVDLSISELTDLYAGCDIVTFISTYEGFGMPILEANAVGRPIITSDLSPMREVAGGAAHLVDPTDVVAIRQGILRLLQDNTYRQTLVEAGLKNARRYTSDTVIKQYVALYRQIRPYGQSISRFHSPERV